MKMLRLALFVLVAIAQIAVPGSVVWKRAKTLRDGRVWKFKTEPVDPVDLFRGRYVALRFTAETFPAEKNFQNEYRNDEQVFAVLRENADGFAEIERLSVGLVGGDSAVAIERRYWDEKKKEQHVSFPFDKFWVNEKMAPAAEKAYRENSRRGKQNAYVTVRVHDGDAGTENLFIENQPLPEYLRAHSGR